jgi:hypothetical protein
MRHLKQSLTLLPFEKGELLSSFMHPEIDIGTLRQKLVVYLIQPPPAEGIGLSSATVLEVLL